MVDFEGMRDKAEDAAGDHHDQVDSGIDKASDAAGQRFGHEDQIDKGADKAKGMVPAEGGDESAS
jgi:antitoxin protein of toxin-antitoxin system